MQGDDLRDLAIHREHRIERRHGILEDHGYLAAADLLHLFVRLFQKILAVIEDLPAQHLAGRIGDKPQNAQRRGGLARAGLAHKAEGIALFQREVDAVHRADLAVVGKVMYGQIFDFKKVHGVPSSYCSPIKCSFRYRAQNLGNAAVLKRIQSSF